MGRLKNTIIRAVFWTACWIALLITLIIAKMYLWAIIATLILLGMYSLLYSYIITDLNGGFTGNMDMSLVSKKWFQIPNNQKGKGIIHCAEYRPIAERNLPLEDLPARPYVICAHGAGSRVEDIELMAVPLIFNGFNVICFNQSGHGTPPHHSTGNGHDYTQVMVNVHDIVDYVLGLPDLAKDDSGIPRIGFIGASTGGIMALSQAYLNSNIKVTVAMSGVHDFNQIAIREPSNFTQRMFKIMLKNMKMKLHYSEEENKIISPKYCLKPLPENKNRVFMVHCKDDVLSFEDALQNKELAGIPDENCLFLAKGGHALRHQETIAAAVMCRWFLTYL